MSRGKKNVNSSRLLQVVEQLDTPSQAEEVGSPLVRHFYKPSEAKKAFMSVISDFSEYGEVDDDDTFDYSLADDTNEVEEFNRALSNSKYAVDDKGVANYEKVFAKNKDELKNFRQFMAFKDIPEFTALAERLEGMSRDDIARFLKSTGEGSDFDAMPSPEVPNE